jgi:hypothetical protein
VVVAEDALLQGRRATANAVGPHILTSGYMRGDWNNDLQRGMGRDTHEPTLATRTWGTAGVYPPLPGYFVFSVLRVYFAANYNF